MDEVDSELTDNVQNNQPLTQSTSGDSVSLGELSLIEVTENVEESLCLEINQGEDDSGGNHLTRLLAPSLNLEQIEVSTAPEGMHENLIDNMEETDCFIDVLMKHKLACPQPLQKQEINPPQKGSSSLVWIVLGLLSLLSIVFVFVWLKRRREFLAPAINRIFRYNVLENSSMGSLAMESSADESTIIFELNSKNK